MVEISDLSGLNSILDKPPEEGQNGEIGISKWPCNWFISTDPFVQKFCI
jgi:hypothetical protein